MHTVVRSTPYSRGMLDHTDSGLPRPVAIAWGLLGESTRGPSRGVTHQQIVEAAIDIADAEGIAAVTMSRVARSVGFSTMALYRYVDAKDDLLLLMLDTATALPEGELKVAADWRAAVRRWVGLLRETYRAHPWALEVVRGPVSVLMPSSVGVADMGLQALDGLRLDEQERIAFILSVSSYVLSFAQLERDLGGQEDLELGPAAMAELGSVITPERWPALAPLILSGGYAGGQSGPDAAQGNDVGFEFEWGLSRLLDGVEQLHEQRAGEQDPGGRATPFGT